MIYIYACPRSGSTWVRQVTSHCFGDHNVKNIYSKNGLPKNNIDPILVVVRNPIDILCSQYRVKIMNTRKKDAKTESHFDEEFNQINKLSVGEIDLYLRAISYGFAKMDLCLRVYPNATLIKYEDVFDKPDILLQKISAATNTNVLDRLDEISEEYSLSKNKERSDKLQNFSNIDKTTRMRGGHVFNGTPGYNLSLLPDDTLEYLQNQFSGIMEKFGYEKTASRCAQ